MTTLRQFLTLVRKDLRMLVVNPTAIALLLVMPLILVAVTSQALDFLVAGRGVDLTVVDLARSATSAGLLEELESVESIDLQVKEWDESAFTESDAEDTFSGRDQFAVLVIPEGWRESASAEPLSFYVDPIQASLATTVRERIESVLVLDHLPAELTDEIAGDGDSEAVQIAVLGVLESPSVDVVTQLGDDARNFPSAAEQTVPGFAVMFGFWLAGFVALFIYGEKNIFVTWQRAVAAPVHRTVMLGSRIFSFGLLAIVQLTVLFTVGVLAWGMELGDSIPGIALTMLAISAVSVSFGLMINALLSANLAQQQTINLSVIVLAAFGGALVPVFLLPGWMAAVSPVTPHYWALSAFQDVIVRGGGVADILPALAVLLAFASAFFSVALVRFRFVD